MKTLMFAIVAGALAAVAPVHAVTFSASADYRPSGTPGGGVVIVDESSQSRTLTLSDPGSSIISVRVSANVSSSNWIINADGSIPPVGGAHYPDELTLSLTSPAGTWIDLISDGTYSGGASGFSELVELTFDDAGATQGGDFITPGVFAPTSGFLSDFIGEDPTGNWTLMVADSVDGDAKSLNAWSITVETDSPAPAANPIPEPATAGLAGLALLSAAGAAMRRRRNV